KPVAITGEPARNRVHLLRAQSDAILVGIGTVLADDPQLDCRLPGMAARSPVRVVLDQSLRIPGASKLVGSAREIPLWVVGSELAEAAAATRLGAAGAQVIRVPPGNASGLDLAAVLHALAGMGITRLMVEGGSRVAASFIAADLVDEIRLFRGAEAVGADGVDALAALPLSKITQSQAYKVHASETFDKDTLTIYERA
ncbi:MAG: RibD family protein, partial [Bradyrhizobium sp.]|nr:RibD family protein [Bradyrhizobium sp.]